jgi:hypothetical protein
VGGWLGRTFFTMMVYCTRGARFGNHDYPLSVFNLSNSIAGALTCSAYLIRLVDDSWHADHAVGLRPIRCLDVRTLRYLYFCWHCRKGSFCCRRATMSTIEDVAVCSLVLAFIGSVPMTINSIGPSPSKAKLQSLCLHTAQHPASWLQADHPQLL